MKTVWTTILCALAACGGPPVAADGASNHAAAGSVAPADPSWAQAPRAPRTVPMPDPAEFPDPHLREALGRLAEALPRDTTNVRYEQRAGPQGVAVLRAVSVGSAPGSGVVSVVWADARTVGVHGERSFADFVRDRGWMVSPPPDSDLVAIADAACFEGMGALRAAQVIQGATLRIVAHLFEPPGPGRQVVIEIAGSGPERITHAAL